ncbi:hypothetical protein MIR68_007775 [Amoeboaphelidium protococcarum]|nr:hypothetical protein MIR68_009447 [Amoeboaphelidium protococcarum]KAI3634171.1 hypothetical protein MIR68_007775 [Amoeboaphelidium protococcarum]KAI3642758.1 hypothetical protein MP228_012313 [Amoeboaphelidium protococcarum]KAI3645397.1 hypothetical protein MP228_008325 [Amoeboaphelidium protococcarum]
MASSLSKVTSLVQNKALTAWSFSKLVYRNANLAPPQLGTWNSAASEFATLIRQGLFARMARDGIGGYTLRNVWDAAKLTVEVAGFFTIGEILARRQIIGYKY